VATVPLSRRWRCSRCDRGHGEAYESRHARASLLSPGGSRLRRRRVRPPGSVLQECEQVLAFVLLDPEDLLKEKVVGNMECGAALFSQHHEHQVAVDDPAFHRLRKHLHDFAERVRERQKETRG
jgi:hypothetical protein